MCSVALPIFLTLTAISALAGLYVVTQPEKENKILPSEQVCFEDLGCFDNGEPWRSPLRPVPLPQRPEIIETILFFYSRQNINNPYAIRIYPDVKIDKVPFDPQRPTLFVIHGFQRNASSVWMLNFKDIYLDNLDANVFLTDWSVEGLEIYLQSVANTRVVGKMLSRFLRFLIVKKGLEPETVHLVGHSLGAQICSYIGKEIEVIGRLTALDPAQPFYEGFDARVRLDKSDAAFVEVVHTDPKPFFPLMGFGTIAPHGHVDFYFNLGSEQPGCILPNNMPKLNSLANMAKFPTRFMYRRMLCSHERATDYLIEAYNTSSDCIFWGRRASFPNMAMSLANGLTQGIFTGFKVHSEVCTPLDCLSFGIDTVATSLTGIFLITTNNKKPYCVVEPGLMSNYY